MLFDLFQSIVPNMAESAVTVVTTLYRIDTMKIDYMEMEASDPVFCDDLCFALQARGSAQITDGLSHSLRPLAYFLCHQCF